MQVDFYQLAEQRAEDHLPALARKVLGTGGRLLVVSDDGEQIARIDRTLWEREAESFLAHGVAGGAHDARQPILLASNCMATNGARFLALADGTWRDDAEGFDRVFLMFRDAALAGARACWRALGEKDGVDRRFWKLEDGRWREGP